MMPEEMTKQSVLTASEREDALRDLFLSAQIGLDLPGTTLNRLVVYKNGETWLLMCGGRCKAFQ